MTDLSLAPPIAVRWPDAPGRLPLTLTAIDDIVAVPDVRVRNLWITASYADLARRMLPTLDDNQSWCSFAIWASNTAGVSIRGDELPTFLTRLVAGDSPNADALVDASSRRGIHRLIGHRLEHHHVRALVHEAIEQVSDHIAHGNTLVYAELAPIFVRYVEHIERHGRPQTFDDVDRLLAAAGVPASEDAPLVHTAFRHYALAATPGAETAQHVLAANIAAVLHEQQRLQDDVAAALDAGLLDVAGEIARAGHSWLPGVVRRLLTNLIERRIAPHVEHLWGEVATHLLMTLDVPGETLHLGRDVPPADGRRELFPADLRELTLPHLQMLMSTWDPTHGTGIGSGASDWADLHERMGYIVNLFRSRQQITALTTPPFDDAQIGIMLEGKLPADV